MTAQVANAKQGLTRIPTYEELIKEIDRENLKTTEIRKVFDRNAWFFSRVAHRSSTEHEQHPPSRLTTNELHKDGRGSDRKEGRRNTQP